jgi:hypothetical protein
MKVIILKDNHPVKVNGKYQSSYNPSLFEDLGKDSSGRWIASFKTLDDALEYISFKNFEIAHNDYQQGV